MVDLYKKHIDALMAECRVVNINYIESCASDGLDKTRCAGEAAAIYMSIAAVALIAAGQPKEEFLVGAALAYDKMQDICV